MAPTLVSMPIEIFHGIIDELPRSENDLKSLRRACREIELKTRVRFGQEYYHRVVLGLEPSGTPPNLGPLQDDMFRHCVHEIELRVDDPDVITEHDLNAGAASDGEIANDTDEGIIKLFQLVPYVKHFSLTCSKAAGDIADDVSKKTHRCWHTVVANIVHILSKQEVIHLESLQLGGDESDTLTIPTFVLQPDLFRSPGFAELKTLDLQGFVDADPADYSSSQKALTTTELLEELLSRTPKLEYLTFAGEGMDRAIANSLATASLSSIYPRHIPPIKEIHFQSVAMTASQLTDGLLMLSATLELMTLDHLRLTLGTWRAVFGIMRTRLRLTYVDLIILRQGDHNVYFLEVAKYRPYILDAQENMYWGCAMEWESGTIDERSEQFQSKEEEVSGLMADGWHWVTHGNGVYSWIVLDKENGDDVGPWLAVVEDKHAVL